MGPLELLRTVGPVEFFRRVPPALSWRTKEKLEPVTRSVFRRAAAARSVWLARAVAPGSRTGAGGRPLVLRFANAHATQLPELRWFAEEVEAASAGAVRIAFVNTWTTTANTREETATMVGVTRHQADLGWAGTRAFGVMGVRSLDPLQAPLLLSDYRLVDAVCRDELAREMLEPLARLDLVGLVVLPGPLRKPFAFTRRLLSPRDYEGAKLRIHESLVAEETYRALGAEAVVLSVRQMSKRPHAFVDGLDLQSEALSVWRLRGSTTYNVNLWPRTIAIAASRKTYDWLGGAERALLAEASARTLARARERLATQEQRDLEALPAEVNPIYAEDDDLAGLRERVEPVYASLRRHPDTGALLERVERIVARETSAAAS